MRPLFVFSVLCFAGLTQIACTTEVDGTDSAGAESEGALVTNAAHTTLKTAKDAKGNAAELELELTSKGGKRVAVVHAKRGDKSADLECSQLTNAHLNPDEDEVVTSCEKQYQPGYEYITVYLRFRPATQRWSFDVITAAPVALSPEQHSLYELFAGRKVVTPALTAPDRNRSHREEALKLKLTQLTKAADPFQDPIALAESVHKGFRQGIGTKAMDRSRGTPVQFEVERFTTYANFDTLEYSANVLGRSADGLWRNGYSIKVSVAETPTTIAAADEIGQDFVKAIESL